MSLFTNKHVREEKIEVLQDKEGSETGGPGCFCEDTAAHTMGRRTQVGAHARRADRCRCGELPQRTAQRRCSV